MKGLLKFGFSLIITLVLFSCGSAKRRMADPSKTETKYYNPPKDQRLINAVNNALEYEGTRYKWGGTTLKGMDCSGLVYVAYGKAHIQLPRVSRAMANEGKRIKVRNANIGDLLFFKTEGSRRINHVGMVVDIRPGKLIFIHSTTSSGVIISSLDQNYWKKAFIEARRMI